MGQDGNGMEFSMLNSILLYSNKFEDRSFPKQTGFVSRHALEIHFSVWDHLTNGFCLHLSRHICIGLLFMGI
jgi:hypothetical protein